MKAVLMMDTPFGPMTLEETDGFLTHGRMGMPHYDEMVMETPLLKEAAKQLEAYFMQELETFDLPVKLTGTAFQVKVWEAVRSIPYGKTASYGDIAKMIGSPKAARAVGTATRFNPISIIVPCHRIIQGDGTLGGFGGDDRRKRELLRMEGVFI